MDGWLNGRAGFSNHPIRATGTILRAVRMRRIVQVESARRWAVAMAFGAILLALLAGCVRQAGPPVVGASVVDAMRSPDAAGWARATEPMTFAFPRDHGPHPAYRTEWWYYTGNLRSEAGDDYGYQLTFFRTGLSPDAPPRASDLATNEVYMAHFALSDGPAQQHLSTDRFARGAGGLAGAQGEPLFSVWLEDWVVREDESGAFHLVAATEGAGEAGDGAPFAIDLTLTSTRPPILHGDSGLHRKGPEAGNASYYYSLVGLDTAGTIQLPHGEVAVTGKSWMDHEFGTSALAEGALGWDWFSLQLDDGSALMLYRFRMAEGAAPVDVTGTWVAPDGTQQAIHGGDFTITPGATWTSPRTGITWPVTWQVSVPSLELELDVKALIPDQEMDVRFVYWEGAVTVEGTRAGVPIAGQGYVELTGYGSDPGDFQR